MNDEKKRELIDALADFSTAIESACVSLKRNLADLLNEEPPKPLWDPDKIVWTNDSGPSGPYQRSEDVDNPEFKAMLKDLAAHGGRMRRGDYFYWTFKNGSTVGRKPIRKVS
jgi:hypothetical protein